MFAHTDTSYAPWYIISTNDKQQARIEVLRAILKQLKADRDTDWKAYKKRSFDRFL